jgi:hypothetical protein
MRDKTYYNSAIYSKISNDNKKYIVEKSRSRDNSKKEIGIHHVIDDAIAALREKDTH